MPVWVAEVTHYASQTVSDLIHVNAAVLRSGLVPLHSSPFQAEALCASCCLGIAVDCFLDGLIQSDVTGVILATKLDNETTQQELLVHILVIIGKA